VSYRSLRREQADGKALFCVHLFSGGQAAGHLLKVKGIQGGKA